jgi:uncharacterized protein (DUF2141 family)
MRKTVHWFVALLWLTALSCARQSAPTGGPKDTIPPVLEKSFPAQNQLNFKGQSIELTFSEMIALANPKEQIIIVPATSNPYDITNRNNRVIIKFDKPLEDSVTYSINFRDAVHDVTEKNPVENLQLAFSTGNYIDSLTIEGHVQTLLTGAPPKEATIAIFPLNDTLSIFKHKPQYITKSNKEGAFVLRNLKPGTYTIHAIEDKNRNLVADSRSESYAHLSSPINLYSDTSGLHLPLVRLDARPLKITNMRPYNTYFNIKTSKNIDNYTLTSRDSIVSSFGEDHANIKVYNTLGTDSTLVRLVATDSIGNKIDSSLYIKFATREVTPEKFTATVEDATILVHRGTFQAKINFTKPSDLFIHDSLFFQIDSLNRLSLADADLKWSATRNEVVIKKKFDTSPYRQQTVAQKANREKPTKEQSAKPQQQTFINKLSLGKGAFISVEKDSSASIHRDIKPQQLEDLGTLTLTVDTAEPYFIAELLTTELKIIRTTRNNKKVRWEDLPPGNYKIRLIIDRNNNGKWDPGNYNHKEEPEPLIYLLRPKAKPENTVFIRANWDVDDILIKY